MADKLSLKVLMLLNTKARFKPKTFFEKIKPKTLVKLEEGRILLFLKNIFSKIKKIPKFYEHLNHLHIFIIFFLKQKIIMFTEIHLQITCISGLCTPPSSSELQKPKLALKS